MSPVAAHPYSQRPAVPPVLEIPCRRATPILGIPQPHVSALARNRSGNFSVGRLIDFLTPWPGR